MSKHTKDSADDRPDPRKRPETPPAAPGERPPLTELKPGEPTSSDEAGDVSMVNADQPMRVREERANPADSSGLPVDDEARGEQIKEQLKRGMRDIRPMD